MTVVDGKKEVLVPTRRDLSVRVLDLPGLKARELPTLHSLHFWNRIAGAMRALSIPAGRYCKESAGVSGVVKGLRAGTAF